jgi:hypothetical protein
VITSLNLTPEHLSELDVRANPLARLTLHTPRLLRLNLRSTPIDQHLDLGSTPALVELDVSATRMLTRYDTLNRLLDKINVDKLVVANLTWLDVSDALFFKQILFFTFAGTCSSQSRWANRGQTARSSRSVRTI